MWSASMAETSFHTSTKRGVVARPANSAYRVLVWVSRRRESSMSASQLPSSSPASIRSAGFGASASLQNTEQCMACLLDTSDATDDLLCVDLGVRDIIQK